MHPLSQYSKDVPVTAKSSKSGAASPDNMVIAQFGDPTLKGGTRSCSYNRS